MEFANFFKLVTVLFYSVFYLNYLVVQFVLEVKRLFYRIIDRTQPPTVYMNPAAKLGDAKSLLACFERQCFHALLNKPNIMQLLNALVICELFFGDFRDNWILQLAA